MNYFTFIQTMRWSCISTPMDITLHIRADKDQQ